MTTIRFLSDIANEPYRKQHSEIRMIFHKILYPVSLVFFVSLIAFPALSQTSTVIVNASETVSASGKNDINVIRNYFYSGTPSDDNLTSDPSQPLWPVELKYANDIGVHGIRSINNERNCSLNSNGDFVPTNSLKASLDLIHRHQWDLHLIVAQSRPPVFPDGAWNWNATQWNAYSDYAYKCIKYVMVDYNGGFQTSIFEVCNEVDISGLNGGYWFVQGSYNNGDLNAYAGYIKCYAAWSDAVKRFNNDYKEKHVRLFGPAISPYTFWYTPESNNWALKFIADAKTNNWQFDALSFHQYASGVLGSRPDYTNGRIPSFKSTIDKIQDKLNANGLSGTEIWLTEWFADSWFDTERINNNYRPVGGAFAAAFMHEALDLGVDGMVPLRLRDPNTDYRWFTIGSLATINQVIYPKPIYNVFKMFNQLPGERKKVEWQNSSVQLGAVASASNNSVGVIVYNYDWDNQNIVDRSVPHDVQVKITGVNMSGSVIVRRFLMDKENSNLAKYVDAGLVPSVADCELKQVEEYTVQVEDGTIVITTKTLGQSAVSMWLVTRSSATDIKELEEKKKDIFRLFPNPADSKVYIQGKSEILPVEVTLYDISGRAVLHETLNPGLPLNIGTLQKGIYIVRISGKKQTRNFRLIKR